MNNRTVILIALAALAAGCDGGKSASMPDPQVQPASFTDWSKQEVFAKAETAAPTDTDVLVFNFDGDDNPDAYTDLLPAGI